jgi:hypothetical protein
MNQIESAKNPGHYSGESSPITSNLPQSGDLQAMKSRTVSVDDNKSFNSKLRGEFLNGEIFSMKEVRVVAER